MTIEQAAIKIANLTKNMEVTTTAQGIAMTHEAMRSFIVRVIGEGIKRTPEIVAASKLLGKENIATANQEVYVSNYENRFNVLVINDLRSNHAYISQGTILKGNTSDGKEATFFDELTPISSPQLTFVPKFNHGDGFMKDPHSSSKSGIFSLVDTNPLYNDGPQLNIMVWPEMIVNKTPDQNGYDLALVEAQKKLDNLFKSYPESIGVSENGVRGYPTTASTMIVKDLLTDQPKHMVLIIKSPDKSKIIKTYVLNALQLRNDPEVGFGDRNVSNKAQFIFPAMTPEVRIEGEVEPELPAGTLIPVEASEIAEAASEFMKLDAEGNGTLTIDGNEYPFHPDGAISKIAGKPNSVVIALREYEYDKDGKLQFKELYKVYAPDGVPTEEYMATIPGLDEQDFGLLNDYRNKTNNQKIFDELPIKREDLVPNLYQIGLSYEPGSATRSTNKYAIVPLKSTTMGFNSTSALPFKEDFDASLVKIFSKGVTKGFSLPVAFLNTDNTIVWANILFGNDTFSKADFSKASSNINYFSMPYLSINNPNNKTLISTLLNGKKFNELKKLSNDYFKELYFDVYLNPDFQ